LKLLVSYSSLLAVTARPRALLTAVVACVCKNANKSVTDAKRAGAPLYGKVRKRTPVLVVPTAEAMSRML